MSEKRFLSSILTEGLLMLSLGLLILVLPKITTITFGVMLCITLFLYGVYKIIHAVITRNYSRHFIFDIILGALISVFGVVLFCLPSINLLLVSSIIGVYFIIESISSIAFLVQIRKMLYFWWMIFIVAFVQFFTGFLIIIGLPTTAFWLVCMLVGINLLIYGISMITLYIANKYVYNI